MNQIYPYCTHCETKLTKEELIESEKIENYHYPVCEKCTIKHENSLENIVSEHKKTNG